MQLWPTASINVPLYFSAPHEWVIRINFPPKTSECQEVAQKSLTRSHNLSQILTDHTNYLNIKVVLYCISSNLSISWMRPDLTSLHTCWITFSVIIECMEMQHLNYVVNLCEQLIQAWIKAHPSNVYEFYHEKLCKSGYLFINNVRKCWFEI